jgi:dolichol kinase
VTSAPGLSFRRELARKAIHLATALLPIAWGLGWIDRLAVAALLSAAVIGALAVEFARHRREAFATWFDSRLGALLRRHEARELSGATWLALGMWSAAMLAPPGAAIAALWAGAVGDASAAIVGRSVAALRQVQAKGKSVVGALSGALATTAGVLWLTDATRWEALGVGVIGALAEWPARPGDDNLRVVLVVALAATLFGIR